MVLAPSGRQLEIAHGDHRVTVVEVGGGIREYECGGRSVLDPYPADRICDGAHGAPLIPWPNRLADGRYSFAGQDHQLALTEPEKGNAIHGLLRWRSWRAAEHEASRVVMASRLLPLPGYPFALDVAIAYELGEGGLSVSTTAENIGDQPCPYGHGQHPYLSPGQGLIDACTLQVDAETLIDTDRERQLPTGRRPVHETDLDLREPRPIDGLKIDNAFTDLTRDPEGRAYIRLLAPDGACAELWVDETFRFLELYTGDTLQPDRARRGLGAEPMTCGPNAFASGDDIIRLEPGESFTSRWGVTLAPE